MAASFTWTAYIDTDLAFSEFFADDFTLAFRYLPAYANGYEGPCVAENGAGTFFAGQGTYFKPDTDREEASPRLLLAVGAQARYVKAAVKSSTWHHLAVVAKAGGSGRTFTLFLNASPVEEITVGSGAPGTPDGTLRFGKRTTGQKTNDRNAQFYGLLADVGIFTRALNAAEIALLAEPGRGFAGIEADLLAGYPLTGGRHPTKLSRPVTLHGPATLVETSADGDSAADAKLLPEPTVHQPMDLPFPPGEAWRTGQAWDSGGSHYGLAAFCWDLTLHGGSGGTYPDGTDRAPVYAAAPGVVITVRESAPPGQSQYGNYADVRQADGEIATYMHLAQESVEVEKRRPVRLGELVGLAGDTGTGVGNFHLHFAVNDKPDQSTGFVTIPIAFSDYEVRGGDGTWTAVPRGVPQPEQIIRNPPTPPFGPGSLAPTSLVSRGANLLDLPATDTAGRVWRARWTPNRYVRNWDRWRPVLADIGSTRPVGVASRSPGRLDIVTADSGGRIFTGGWNEHHHHGVWGGWWRIRDHVAKPNAPVAIVARAPGTLDVFSVRSDGAISTAAWDTAVADGEWRGWWSVAGGVTVPLGWVTAVSRAPDRLDVFMVGTDGGVYTAAWEHGAADGKWRGWWRIGDMVARPGSYVAAVARDPEKLDVFAVRTDGAISSAAWDRRVADSKWRGWWSIADGTTEPGTPIAAVSRHPEKLDLFVVRQDGGIYTAAWDRNVARGAWRGWWRVRDLVAFPRSAVAAVAREPDKLDIVAVRTDGQMSTAAWDHHAAGGEWQGWWRIG